MNKLIASADYTVVKYPPRGVSDPDQWYMLFLKWLFKDRDNLETDLEYPYDNFKLYLRKNKCFDSYITAQNIYKKSQKEGSIARDLKLPNIHGTTQRHIEWGERIRLNFLKETEHLILARFFTDINTFSITDRSSFWVNLRKYNYSEIETIPIVISTLHLRSRDTDTSELERKKSQVHLLNYLYGL